MKEQFIFFEEKEVQNELDDEADHCLSETLSLKTNDSHYGSNLMKSSKCKCELNHQHDEHLERSEEENEHLDVSLLSSSYSKNSAMLKIQADLKTSKWSISIYFSLILFSILFKFEPLGEEAMIIYSIPIFVILIIALAISLEYRNSYLNVPANSLSHILVTFICYYSFLCMLVFLILINLKKAKFPFISKSPVIFLMVPIYSLLLILNIFWIFLYWGFQKQKNLGKYFLIMTNLIVFSSLTVTIYLKLSDSLKVGWVYLSAILVILLFLNYIHYNRIIDFFKSLMEKSNSSFDSKSKDSVILSLDFLSALCLTAYIYMQGLYLDNYQINEIILYCLIWGFSIFNLLKAFYKIGKISSYFEWKKMVII